MLHGTTRQMQRRLAAMFPDEVLAEVKKQIRKHLGDDTENRSKVWASHGYYYVTLPSDSFQNLRRQWNRTPIRRKALAVFFDQMKKTAKEPF